jgi:hypothetical protein
MFTRHYAIYIIISYDFCQKRPPFEKRPYEVRTSVLNAYMFSDFKTFFPDFAQFTRTAEEPDIRGHFRHFRIKI